MRTAGGGEIIWDDIELHAHCAWGGEYWGNADAYHKVGACVAKASPAQQASRYKRRCPRGSPHLFGEGCPKCGTPLNPMESQQGLGGHRGRGRHGRIVLLVLLLLQHHAWRVSGQTDCLQKRRRQRDDIFCFFSFPSRKRHRYSVPLDKPSDQHWALSPV